MEKLDLAEQMKECPNSECEGIMRVIIATRTDMTGYSGDDNTTMVEWWECLDCGYYEEA